MGVALAAVVGAGTLIKGVCAMVEASDAAGVDALCGAVRGSTAALCEAGAGAAELSVLATGFADASG
jgi:hypothetical protein